MNEEQPLTAFDIIKAVIVLILVLGFVVLLFSLPLMDQVPVVDERGGSWLGITLNEQTYNILSKISYFGLLATAFLASKQRPLATMFGLPLLLLTVFLVLFWFLAK